MSDAQIKISVTGDELARAALDKVRAAMGSVGEAAPPATQKLDALARGMSMAGDAASASGKMIAGMSASGRQAMVALEEPATRVTGVLGNMGTQLVATAAGFVSAQAVLGAVGGAFRIVVGTVQDSVKAFAEADAAQIHLTAALRQQHTFTPALADGYNAMASAFQRTTVHGDDTINMMQGLLVQVGGVMPGAMKGALEAATNLSAGLGIDLQTATTLVAKAASGHTETLGKYGIQVSEAALKTQGFDAVLTAINRQFGGQAQAELETYAGKVKQIGNDWNNVQEVIGKIVLTNEVTTAGINLLTHAARGLDQQTQDTTVSLGGLAQAMGMSPTTVQALAFLELYLGRLNAIEATSARMAAMPSPFAQNAKDMLPPIVDISGAMKTWDLELAANKKALDEAAAAAKRKTAELKALKEAQDKARIAMLAGVEGTKELTLKTLSLGDALGMAGGSQGVVPALRDLERFSLRATSDVKALGLSVDELGRRGVFGAAVLGDLNKQILLLPNVTPGATAAIAAATGAVVSLRTEITDRLTGALANIPNLLMAAFTGGGGLMGAVKAIGVQISDAIIAPLMAKLSRAQQIAVGAAGAGVAALSGAAGLNNTTTAIIGIGTAMAGTALAATAAASATAAFAAGTATTAAVSIGTTVAIGAATLGIGAAAIGVALLAKHYLSVSAAEKTARLEFEAYQKQYGTLDEMISAVGAAYALTGRTGAQAEQALKVALDATHHSAADVHAALVTINDVMVEAQAKSKALVVVDDRMQALLGTIDAVGIGLPDMFRPMINDLLKMPGLTDSVKASLQGLASGAATNFKKLEAEASGFGIKLGALGPAFQQAHVTDEASNIINFLARMQAAGADMAGVFAGMADEASAVVQESLKFGTTVPENMRGMIESLITSGGLLDENGKKIDDISTLKFGDPVKTDVEKVADAIQKLVEAIEKIPGAIAAVGDGVSGLGRGMPRVIVDDAPPSFANEAYDLSRPLLARIGDAHGDSESVLRASTVKDIVRAARRGGTTSSPGGGGTITIVVPVNLEGRQVARVVVPLIPAELRRLGVI